MRSVCTSKTRSKFLPDIPPIADTVPGFDLTSWSGVFAGGGNVPKPIVDRLAKEITAIMKEKDMQAPLDKLGFELYLSKDQDEFATFVSDQLKLWASDGERGGRRYPRKGTATRH